jgi:hypothetical protein
MAELDLTDLGMARQDSERPSEVICWRARCCRRPHLQLKQQNGTLLETLDHDRRGTPTMQHTQPLGTELHPGDRPDNQMNYPYTYRESCTRNTNSPECSM